MWRSQWFSIGVLLGTLLAGGVQGQNITEFPVPGPYPVPDSITSGPDGNLWFTEQCSWARSCEGKIGRITLAGVVTEFPARGPWPGGIAAGPDGNLWFTNGSAIGRITPTGDVTQFPLSKVSAGPGIVAGQDGSLWFAGTDISGDKIGRVTTAGAITTFAIPAPGRWPYGIAAGPDGNLWFTLGYNDFEPGADTGKIGRITSTGVITLFTVPKPNGGAAHIAAGPDGNLWFTEPWDNRIGRITTTGVISEFPLDGGREGWTFAITAGPDGAVWFTHFEGISKVGRITTSGEITEFSIPTANAGLSGIAAGSDGNIWFAEGNVNKIGRLTLGGVAGACVADSTTLCLTGARFQARVTWTTSDGRTGTGQAVSLTGNTGYFWFFSSDNVEVMVKVVDGCALNSYYWVFVGGLTDIHVAVTVTDTATGAVKTYTNPQKVAFQSIQDTTTFRGP